MGVETAEVASSHHQAVARLGDGLVVSGRAPDGILEAVEHPEGSWVVAVQWHPERTADADPAQQGLFDALVEHAGS
jgi:putative glutamine amidotransferase